MIEDRNKTALTKAVTKAAYAWLDEKGAKPVETEVPLCEGWVADLAGVMIPTQTEFQDLKLIRRKPSWRADREAEINAWYAEVAALPDFLSCLVEAKTSRSDFTRDEKWSKPSPTNLAYLAMPNDLPIHPDEFPVGWGLLLYSAATGTIRQTRVPKIHEVGSRQQLNNLYQIAIRRDHFTRYERHRSLQREIRDEQGQRTTCARISSLIGVITDIVKGQRESVQGALDWRGIKHVPAHYIKQLEGLWAIAPDLKDPRVY